MIKRKYYPINEASTLLNCSVEDLLHLGATGKITLYLNYTHRSMMHGLVYFISKANTNSLAKYSDKRFFPEELLPVTPKVCRAFEGVHASRSLCISSLFFKTLDNGDSLWLIPFNPNLETNYDVFEVYRSELFLLSGTIKDLMPSKPPSKQNTPSKNNTNYSCLINIPQRTDDWFDAIDDMTKNFHSEHGKLPNKAQAWANLMESPPDGYMINVIKEKGEDCLNMPGNNPLSRSAFEKRWKNYTKNDL